MLSDKIAEAVEIIENVTYFKETANDNEKAAKRNNIFFDSFDKLSISVKLYILVKKYFDFTLSDDALLDMQNLMEESAKTFDNLRAVKPQSFKDGVEALNLKIGAQWEVFIKDRSGELIRVLSILTQIYPNPTLIKRYIQALKACAKWDFSKDKIDIYLEAEDSSKNIIKQMNFNSEIRDFLDKLSNKTATLSDLTSTVHTWIRDKGLADRIILSVK